MGRKNKKKSKKPILEGNPDSQKMPFVSVCTPTFNRRPFIEHMIKCFEHQDYPRDRVEWIIIDDGTDKIGEMVSHIPEVKYFSYDKKMVLGKKRNLLHEKSKGDIIVYMDDDDYYPPDRISHAVERLQQNPEALCAGSSEIYIYFKHIEKMYQFGPYGPNHATAGTFAFKRELIKNTKYDSTAALAEEKSFLKNYTIPFVQLDPMKTILVFSHEHNTFDKRKLLENPHPNFVKESPKTVDMFVKDEEMKDFYMNRIGGLLEHYEAGSPSMKPDVLKQIIEIEEQRRKHAEHQAHELSKQQTQTICIQQGDGVQQTLTIPQVVDILQKQQTHINELVIQLQGKDAEIQMLQTALSDLEKKCDIQDATDYEIVQNIQLNVVEHTKEAGLGKVPDTDEIDNTDNPEDILVQINQEN
jgi:hypothetical protein